MELLIYKTNLRSNKKVRSIAPTLNRHPDILRWTVDREDIDNVLRIEAAESVQEKEFKSLMKQFGIYCEDLPD